MRSQENPLPRRAVMWGAAILGVLLLLVGYQVIRYSLGRVAGDFFYPYLELTRQGESELSDLTLLAFSQQELAAKVERLQEKNQALALQAAAAGELLQENQELRKLVKLHPAAGWSYISAEILLRDPLLWRERFSVNRGSADGVVPGAAVLSLSPEGRPRLVGIVDETGLHTCRIITIYDPTMRLSVRFPGNGAVGVLNFGERRSVRGGVPVGMLPVHYHYAPGAAVVTTGFEQNIPAGILVGELTSSDPEESNFSNRTQLNGFVSPAADFTALRFLVIARRNGVSGVPLP